MDLLTVVSIDRSLLQEKERNFSKKSTVPHPVWAFRSFPVSPCSFIGYYCAFRIERKGCVAMVPKVQQPPLRYFYGAYLYIPSLPVDKNTILM
jgi:hypothetical protein